MTITYQQMPEGVRLDLSMPRSVKLEIANCIILFGRIEQKVIEIAWALAGSTDVKARVKRAGQPAHANFEEILSIVEQAAGDKFDAMRTVFNSLRHDRNLIAHGFWLMADDKPYVVWHKFITDADGVMGEFFDRQRFERFRKRGETLFETCRKWHDMLSAQGGITQSALSRVPDSDSQK
jgi:hypothetical protein